MDISDYSERLQTTGRNDPCPCGSGKKYKKCHLAGDEEAKHVELAKAAEEREAALASEEVEADSGDRAKTKDAAVKRGMPHRQGKTAPSRDRHTNIPRRGAI